MLSGDEDSMTSQDDDSFNFMNLAKASAEIGMKLYKEVGSDLIIKDIQSK